MAASDFQAVWSASEVYAFRGWVPSVHDAGWGRRPPPPPPPPLRLELLDYVGCLVIVLVVCITALHFRGFLLDDEYSIVNVLALLLTRIMHMLVMKSSPAPSSWTALALLPTCPAPALSTPPVCYGTHALRLRSGRSTSFSPSSNISRSVCFLATYVFDGSDLD